MNIQKNKYKILKLNFKNIELMELKCYKIFGLCVMKIKIFTFGFDNLSIHLIYFRIYWSWFSTEKETKYFKQEKNKYKELGVVFKSLERLEEQNQKDSEMQCPTAAKIHVFHNLYISHHHCQRTKGHSFTPTLQVIYEYIHWQNLHCTSKSSVKEFEKFSFRFPAPGI